jgi:hypothetical protein
MKRRALTGGVALLSGLGMAIGLACEVYGLIPLWGYEVLLVALFPVFIICLFFWWMAGEHEPDIPFLGY